jgi:hypothetical protein
MSTLAISRTLRNARGWYEEYAKKQRDWRLDSKSSWAKKLRELLGPCVRDAPAPSGYGLNEFQRAVVEGVRLFDLRQVSAVVEHHDAAGGKPPTGTQPTMLIGRESDGRCSHSCNFDQRRRPETLRTAMATAFLCPTKTTSRLPRVTPVYSKLRCNMV